MLDLRKRDDQVQKLNQNDLNQEALKLLEQARVDVEPRTPRILSI
jgi:hypothetical protein